MKINAAKIGIFVVGGAVGAVISAVVTRNLVDKTYREAADEEIYKAWKESKTKIDGYKAQIKELEEKISQQKVTISTLADQVRSNGGTPEVKEASEDDDTEDDIRPSVGTSSREDLKDSAKRTYERYSKRYRPNEDDIPEGVEFMSPEIEEKMIEKSGPRVISEEEFSENCLDYTKSDLEFYLFDGKMLSEDGEYLDNYAGLVGENWKLHGRNAGDEVYVRNDHLAADYRIIFMAGAGEEHISMADMWDD